ncbi:unnamed protein product, partial [Brenthis ino]
MPLSGCTNSLVGLVTLVTLLLIPQYYVPDRLVPEEPVLSKNVTQTWVPLDIPSLDLFLTLLLVSLAAIIYIWCWIQRKLLERRIMKLNQNLNERLEVVRSWDARQEELEVTLKMIRRKVSKKWRAVVRVVPVFLVVARVVHAARSGLVVRVGHAVDRVRHRAPRAQDFANLASGLLAVVLAQDPVDHVHLVAPVDPAGLAPVDLDHVASVAHVDRAVHVHRLAHVAELCASCVV